MKELVIIISLLQPKTDSVLVHSLELFHKDAKRYSVTLSKKEIKLKLTSRFTGDTLAISEIGSEAIISLDLGTFISLIDEPGRLLTILYHEFGHIYLDKKDTAIGETIMNYKYISIDLLNDPKREMYLRNLFRIYK